MSHTDGPWEVSGDGIWATSRWNARVRLATFTFPAPMNGIDGNSNLRLAAAGPSMLEALQTTRRNIVSLRDAGLPGPMEEWLRVVDETISLATSQ